MGLDMYLYVREMKYLSPECSADFKIAQQLAKDFVDLEYPGYLSKVGGMISDRNFPSKHDIKLYQVGYWRKANAIHKWIVDNCARGIDNCGEIFVSRENLQELKKQCVEVLKDNSKAPALLPTEPGFFFGSLEYDEYYFKNLEYTIALIDELEKIQKYDKKTKISYDIVYQANW